MRLLVKAKPGEPADFEAEGRTSAGAPRWQLEAGCGTGPGWQRGNAQTPRNATMKLDGCRPITPNGFAISRLLVVRLPVAFDSLISNSLLSAHEMVSPRLHQHRIPTA